MKKFCLIFLVSFLFAGCASLRNGEGGLNKVYVTNSTPVELLPVQAMVESVEEYQYFEGDFGRQKFASLLYLEADSTHISVLILNEMGIEIGSITYDGKRAVMDSSLFPKQLKCEYILLDLQNTYCDPQLLQEHYKKYGLDFAAADSRRTISRKGTLIEEITFEENLIQIKNHLRGYTYRLQSQ